MNEGWTWTASGTAGPALRWVLIPLLGALIGYATNVAAVRMIFRPRRPWGPPGLRIQGLIPKRRAELARAVARTVERHLISAADVQAVLERPAVRRAVEAQAAEWIGRMLDRRLAALPPPAGLLLAGGLRRRLEAALLEDAQALAGEWGARLVELIEDELDMAAIVEARMLALDPERLETIVRDVAGRELRAIEWLGAALGLAIGLAQAALAAL